MKDKVNCSAKREPEDVFIDEAYEAFEAEQIKVVNWCCSGDSIVWIDDDGKIIFASKILPQECVRIIEKTFDEFFIRKKLTNACRKAGLKLFLINEYTIKVCKKSA